MPPDDKYYFSKSLEKGLKILSLFSRASPSLTQTEIARLLGMNMTSTYRYINTLMKLGYLEKDPATKSIRPSFLCLAFCTNLMRATDNYRFIKNLVDQYHARFNVTIDVAYAVDDAIMRIYHREAEDTLTYSLPDSTRNCLHNTSLGKAYLSSLPRDQLERKIEALTLKPRTKRTIIDKGKLLAEIEKTRQRRYSIANEEYLTGLISIGSPLFDPRTGRGIGAVCFDFSILQNNAGEIEEKYAPLIIELAESISQVHPVNHPETAP